MKKFGFLLLLALLSVGGIHAAHAAKVDSISNINTCDSNYQSSDYTKLLMEKLSPQQILELEKYRTLGHDSDEPKLSSVGIMLISLMPFLTAILIVFFVIRNRRMKEERMFQLYEKALDAGKDLPDSFFRRSDTEPQSNLLKGLIWIGVGIGVSYGALKLMGDHSPWAFGLIPAFVGLAYLISYFVEHRNKANTGKDE
jgi:hypothetical protein